LCTASFLPVDAAFKCPGKRNGDLYRAVAVIALADIDKTRIPNLLPLREIYAIMSHYRSYLAFAAVCLGLAHLALMAVVHKRCPHDTALKLARLVLGLFFITIAIPLYLKMYAVALTLAGGGVILALIPTPVTEGLQSEKSYSCLFL
jgi:hypothetical protein